MMLQLLSACSAIHVCGSNIALYKSLEQVCPDYLQVSCEDLILMMSIQKLLTNIENGKHIYIHAPTY